MLLYNDYFKGRKRKALVHASLHQLKQPWFNPWKINKDRWLVMPSSWLSRLIFRCFCPSTPPTWVPFLSPVSRALSLTRSPLTYQIFQSFWEPIGVLFYFLWVFPQPKVPNWKPWVEEVWSAWCYALSFFYRTSIFVSWLFHYDCLLWEIRVPD